MNAYISYLDAISQFKLINSGFEGFYQIPTIINDYDDVFDGLTKQESNRVHSITRFFMFYENKLKHMINLKEYEKFYLLVLLEPSIKVLNQCGNNVIALLLVKINGFYHFEYNKINVNILIE